MRDGQALPLFCLAVPRLGSLGPALCLAPRRRGQHRGDLGPVCPSASPRSSPAAPAGQRALFAVQSLAPPARFAPFPFPSVLPPTHPFIKSGTTKPSAEQSTRRVLLFPPPQAEKQDSVCQLRKGAYFHGLCSGCGPGPRARSLRRQGNISLDTRPALHRVSYPLFLLTHTVNTHELQVLIWKLDLCYVSRI